MKITDISNSTEGSFNNGFLNLNKTISIKANKSHFLEWLLGDWDVKEIGTAGLDAVKKFAVESKQMFLYILFYFIF